MFILTQQSCIKVSDMLDDENYENNNEQNDEMIENNKNDRYENDENREYNDEQNNDVIVKYEAKIASLTKERNQFKDLAMRLKADFDNFRKRLDSESKQMTDTAMKKVFTNILDIVDSYELAIKNFNLMMNDVESEVSDKHKVELENNFKGILFTYDLLKKMLEDNGVKELVIDLNKKPLFDPKYHEALLTENVTDCDDKVVLEVFQKAYVYKDQVLRHAKVKIACKIKENKSNE